MHQRVWGPWNYVAFWLADSINVNTWMIGMIAVVLLADFSLFQYTSRTILVGMLALRLGWIHNYRVLRRSIWSNGRCLSYFFPGHQSWLLRHLGILMANLQSRRHGMYLVWRTSLDRRPMRLYHASCNCSQHRQHSKWYGRFRNGHQVLYVFLPVLVILPPGDLVPCLQNSTSLHCQIIHRPCRGHIVHGLGHCESRRSGSDHSSRIDYQWKCQRMGCCWRDYGLRF